MDGLGRCLRRKESMIAFPSLGTFTDIPFFWVTRFSGSIILAIHVLIRRGIRLVAQTSGTAREVIPFLLETAEGARHHCVQPLRRIHRCRIRWIRLMTSGPCEGSRRSMVLTISVSIGIGRILFVLIAKIHRG
jgi:hypothetical protein